MSDEIVVQYRFKDETTGFADAIVLPLDDFLSEYGPLSKPHIDKIDAVKQERIANWQAALSAPQPEPDLKAEAQALADEVALLTDRLAVASAELAVKMEVLPVKDRPKVAEVEAVAEGL